MSAQKLKSKILISACLLGDRVRYDGAAKALDSDLLRRWQQAGRVIKVCPEVMGGLATPRDAAEIQRGADSIADSGVGSIAMPDHSLSGGKAVWAGQAQVKTEAGRDVTAAFIAGAQQVLEIAQQENIKWALLKANSPSCGNQQVYSGRFDGALVAGQGVTVALLGAHGVQVFNESEIDKLNRLLETAL